MSHTAHYNYQINEDSADKLRLQQNPGFCTSLVSYIQFHFIHQLDRKIIVLNLSLAVVLSTETHSRTGMYISKALD